MWGKVCGQKSVLPDADEQHAQSCASLSPPFSSGHIPGCKCKYINNKKMYLNQHADVCLAAFFVGSKNLTILQLGRAPRAPRMLCLGKVLLALLWLEWNPLFPPSTWVVFASEMKAALSLIPHCLGMLQVTFLGGTQGELGGFHKVFCLVLLITCSNIK